MQSAHLCQTLVELYNECLLHKPLVYIGIHCLNIREVIHWEILQIFEQYFQDCGHAGWDGLPAKARCTLEDNYVRNFAQKL